MNILYIGSFRLPNHDAAAARVLNIARAIRLAGHVVSFISWGGEQRESDLCSDGKYRVDGFEYIVTHELPFNEGLVQRMINKLTRGNKTKQLLRQKLGCYDAIITYNCNLSRWLIGFTRKHKIKLINDITEWYDYGELKVSDWLPYAWNMYHTQKKMPNKILISSYLASFYKKTHNIVVPATCDITEEKWKRKAWSAIEKCCRFDGITLIYAGNPARKDAVHHVINAIQRLIEEGANLRFLFLGIERESYIEKYSNLLRTTVFSEKIHFLGRVSQDDVPSYYALADFMVLLRDLNRKNTAGFPTKFTESFVSGTPVIANLTSDLGGYLFDGKTGFVVDEPNEESIYETLKYKVIGLSPSKIEEMKCNVKEEAKRLDYHYFKEPLEKFMEELQ